MIALEESVNAAAAALAGAEALLIGAGAGMGVDSGLPDFRGTQGFWRAYPPYQKLGLDFVSLANPRTPLCCPGLRLAAISANPLVVFDSSIQPRSPPCFLSEPLE